MKGIGIPAGTFFNALSGNVPSIQATNLILTPADTTATISWTKGNGTNSLVIVKASSVVDSLPVDLSSYTANAAFGSGSQLGTGNYVVYGGTSNTVNITNLTAGTTYHVRVCEFNGTSYNTSLGTNNPSSFTTNSSLTADYYVRIGGSDGAAGTSIGTAWATMEHARSVVQNGDVLDVGVGVFTVNEYLAWPACSITGAGIDQTIFKIHSSKFVQLQDNPFTTQSSGLCLFNCKTTGTRLNVPFTFQNFTIDGDKPTGSHTATTSCMGGGITVVNRDGFTMNNVKVIDTGHWGVWLWNSDNSRITSCESYNAGRGRVASGTQPWSYGMGHFPFYRVNNFEFDNNYSSDDWGSQPMGARGGNWTSAAYSGGTLNICDGVSIHDNYMTLDPVGPWVSPNGSFSPAISMEFIRVYAPNTEIYNNDIDGNISLGLFRFDDNTQVPEVHTAKGTTQYHIHHNFMYCKRRSSSSGEYGVEMIANDLDFHDNYINANNYHLVCFQGDSTHGLRLENVNIYKNVFDGMKGNSAFTGFVWHAQGVKNLNVWNNTGYWDSTSSSTAVAAFVLFANPGTATYANAGVSENISIRNNICVKPSGNVATAYSVYKSSTHSITNLVCTNNNFQNCNVTSPSNSASIGVFNNNLNVNPLIQGAGLVPDPYYRLQSGSPMIDAGTNVGLSYVGANPDIGNYEFGVVTTRDIVSLSAVPITTVDQGTTLGSVPLGSVQATLDDDSTINLNLAYSSGTYDGNTPDTYSLTCTPVLTSGITNTLNLSVVKSIIVRSISSLITDDFERASLGANYTEVDPNTSLSIVMDNSQALAMSAFQDSFESFIYRNDFAQENEVKITTPVNYGVLDSVSFGNGIGLQNLYGSLSISGTEPNYGVVCRVNTILGHEDFGKLIIYSGDGTVGASYVERNKSSIGLNLILNRVYDLSIERIISGSDAVYTAYLQDTITGQQITTPWVDIGDLLGTKYSETYPAFFAFGGYPKIQNLTIDEINVSAPTYGSRLTAWIDYINSQAETLPSSTILAKLDTCLEGIPSGDWNVLDWLYITRLDNGASFAARVNFKNPGNYTLSPLSAPVFVNNVGYQFDSIDDAFNTGFNPQTAGGNFTQNVGDWGLYIGNDVDDSTGSAMGCQEASSVDGIFINPRNGTNTVTIRINNASPTSFQNDGTSVGLYHTHRTGASTTSLNKNGVQQFSSTRTATGLPNANVYLGATNNNGSLATPGPYTIGMAFMGGNIDVATLDTLWDAYIS